MLTMEILAKISAKKKYHKITNKQLADILGVKYSTLTMTLKSNELEIDVSKINPSSEYVDVTIQPYECRSINRRK